MSTYFNISLLYAHGRRVCWQLLTIILKVDSLSPSNYCNILTIDGPSNYLQQYIQFLYRALLAYASRATLHTPPDAHGTIDTCTAAKSVCETCDRRRHLRPTRNAVMCALLYMHMLNTRYTSHERRGRRGRSSHQRLPRPAKCCRGGRHGRRRHSPRHPAAQALAAHRGLTRAHTRNKLLARARLRVDAPGDGEDRAHELVLELWREWVVGLRVHAAFSVILPADDSARASDVCVCVRAS
jgi:hypothetical protein